MHCIKKNFDKIKIVLKGVLADVLPVSENLLRPGPVAKFTDLDVITLSVTAECLGIDSELLLFTKLNAEYQDKFPDIISRRQFNDRRKILFKLQEIARERLATKLNADVNVFAVDSMPLEICKMARAERNKLGKSHNDPIEVAPNRGFCAAQNKHYYGYKIHAVTSPAGVLQMIDITPASVHDVNFLKDIKEEFKDCDMIGDKGYISKELHKELSDEKNIKVRTGKRGNQKEFQKLPYVFRKIRKRVETIFSQLCDQFMIQRNYAKSFQGYRTRILAKISGMTTLNYLNKFINDKPIGQIKYALK